MHAATIPEIQRERDERDTEDTVFPQRVFALRSPRQHPEITHEKYLMLQ